MLKFQLDILLINSCRETGEAFHTLDFHKSEVKLDFQPKINRRI